MLLFSILVKLGSGVEFNQSDKESQNKQKLYKNKPPLDKNYGKNKNYIY